MSYETLDTEEQEILDALVNYGRGLASELAKLLDKFVDFTDTYGTAGVTAILGELLDADEIPNKSGLTGAQPVTKAEFAIVAAAYDSLSDPAAGSGSYNTPAYRAYYAKLAGPSNLSG